MTEDEFEPLEDDDLELFGASLFDSPQENGAQRIAWDVAPYDDEL